MSGDGSPIAVGLPPLRLSPTLRALRRLFVTLAVLAVLGLAAVITVDGIHRYGFGGGSRAYWLAWRHDSLYSGKAEQVGSYLYTPLFAQLIWPLTLLSWPLFAALWASFLGLLFAWLLWPLRLTWRIVAMLLVVPEIVEGNVWALFAVVLVVGFRFPSAWAAPLLTKVTAGVGVVWFAARREWRPLAVTLGTTAALVAVSVAVGPSQWHNWLVFVVHGGGRGSGYATHGRLLPPVVRLPIALAILVIAARQNRITWLPWAMLLAAPVFGTYNFALLAALPRLSRLSRQRESDPLSATLDGRTDGS